MPTFIDYHERLPEMPRQAMDEIAGRIRAGEPDEFGVKGVNVFLAKDGRAYCLSEAPSADAVVASHRAHGVPLEDHEVLEVTSVV